MNLQIGNTVPQIRKRASLRAIAGAGGLALALSAAIGLGVFDREGGSGTTVVTQPPVEQAVQSPARTFVPTAPAGEMTLVYYIVGSEEEALGLRRAIHDSASEAGASDGTSTDLRHVIVARDAGEEAAANALISLAAAETIETGATVEVVDLR
jgi:hypothetical protein